jgi:hypothetical protein
MILIVEGYNYKSDKVRRILEGFDHKELKESISTDCVGYCYDKSLDDCIFFVPKVICDSNDKVLGKYSPDDCVDLTNGPVSSEEKVFLQELNIWIYRALQEYSKLEESIEILQEKHFSVIDSVGDSTSGTFLDRILGLIKFYNENRDFILFTIKSIHSQNHKINWRKTVSQSQSIVLNGVPFYLDPISKKKTIDWDEELMIIFFSILNYTRKYGFDFRFESQYELIQGEHFTAYREGIGVRRLRQIRHRYFSDRTRKLWSLCYSFFEATEYILSNKEDSDYLIATSFHIAFEAIVDELIGQPEFADMRNLEDGKVIDHIYQDRSLLSNDPMFYIGDSKYYKTRYSVQERSLSAYKQFTYARNIVHDSIQKSFKKTWPFRDPLTEGYCITPNFFISAEIDPEHRFDCDGFEKKDVEGTHFSSRQFNNRLFDRDTLWVNQYNLNFLFLLSTYAMADSTIKETFKIKAHRFFRDKTIDLLNKEYEFWELTPKNGLSLEETISNTIKWEIRGTVYRLGKDGNSLLFAMEKPDEPLNEEDNAVTKYEREYDFNRIKPLIEAHFEHRRCQLSKNEGEVIQYVDEGCSSGQKNSFCYMFDNTYQK